jgi:hypothetical protein
MNGRMVHRVIGSLIENSVSLESAACFCVSCEIYLEMRRALIEHDSLLESHALLTREDDSD